ncbi:hypothetical protein L484_027982 [Morus notabilis]|uniref:Uncharacterized protein n=1 Tax=Morus notabilis TaxID=981085 RepID=W9SFT9_9ROSA|nr:hypothetical protein L484_027982 [Morus notabilis]
MQTTYENFRYRYDKKENPYHKGTTGNCAEIFCSSIPRSMNKFRSFIEEDEHVMVTSVTPDLGEGVMSSKEKIDIEMGARHAEDSGFPLPNILRNLDYDDIENNLKSTEDERRHVLGAYFPVETEVKESLRRSSGGNGRMDGQIREPMRHSPARERVRESVEGTMLIDGTIEGNNDRK